MEIAQGYQLCFLKKNFKYGRIFKHPLSIPEAIHRGYIFYNHFHRFSHQNFRETAVLWGENNYRYGNIS